MPNIIVLPLLSILVLQQSLLVWAQDDFTDPITCYICEGKAKNSTCADPIEVKDNKDVDQKKCAHGICLKWTFFREGVLQIQRACSIDLNFHLTMINGVCRTERNGNGYLCMCGRNLCNAAARSRCYSRALLLLLVCYSFISQRLLPWR